MSSPATSSGLDAAFPAQGEPDREIRFSAIRRLYDYYERYMAGPEKFDRIPRLNEDRLIAEIETRWLAWEEAQIDAASLPTRPEQFRDWYLEIMNGHRQPDFCRYVAEEADIAEIALFFTAEELVDGRFDDLVALVQIGATGQTKMAIAENYWDEMGEGDLERVHTRLFEHSARYMRERLAEAGSDGRGLEQTEVYENATLLLAYGVNRHLVPRALGAMGILEHTAPVRFGAMVDACRRLGVPSDVIEYQRVHVHIDADHGAEWFEAVILPLVSHSSALLREISVGVATRVRVGEAYYAQVWRQMVELRKLLPLHR